MGIDPKNSTMSSPQTTDKSTDNKKANEVENVFIPEEPKYTI